MWRRLRALLGLVAFRGAGAQDPHRARGARCHPRPGEDRRVGCGQSRSFAREENAMKFMFTIYHDENVLDAMPEKEMRALVDSAIEYAEEIR